jgi:membrane-associated phospholipid phosphatase
VLLVLALVYTYFRHRETYALFRDAVLFTNSLGLLGYLFLPTAPPRLLAGYGFRNDLSGQPTPDHATGLIAFAANPYAAMPSLHVADAILIRLFLASLSGSLPVKALWLLWPCWLSYVVIASGNHFWLDVAAGAALAGRSLLISSQLRQRRTPDPYASPTSHQPRRHVRMMTGSMTAAERSTGVLVSVRV